jgi:hypothetical protein
MPRGGRRPGSGAKKGSKHRTVTATLDEVAAMEAATRKLSCARMSKDILTELANFCFDVANEIAPQTVDGNLIWREPWHERSFFAFIDRAGLFAARAAPYESPTYRAIAVMTQSQVDKPRQLSDHTMTHDDQIGASRAYAAMVKASKMN